MFFSIELLKAQGIDRSTLPYCGWGQPYCGYIASCILSVVTLCFGYTTFLGPWDNGTFFSNYTLVLLAPVLFIFWKVIKRTKFIKPHEADLIWERPLIDAHEQTLTDPDIDFWGEMLQMATFGKRNHIRTKH